LTLGRDPPYEIQRALVEFILIKRNDALIDWGLARYGYETKVVQKAFDRGNVGTKLAALANPYGSVFLHQSIAVLMEGKNTPLWALLSNPYLPSRFLKSLLRRKADDKCSSRWDFSDISDDRFRYIIHALAGNKKLNRHVENWTFEDPYSMFDYEDVFKAAWDLTRTVPPTQVWANPLRAFLPQLDKSRRPTALPDLAQTLDRWRIDREPERQPPRSFDRSPSFAVRSLVADFIQADQSLLQAKDAALRMSFYRRFSPKQFPDWPDWIEKDGEEFVNAVLDNEQIWKTSAERWRLQSVCEECHDPYYDMECWKRFKYLASHYEKDNPQWFAEEDDAFPSEVEELRSFLDERLLSIDERLSGILAFVDQRLWTIWYAAAAVVVMLIVILILAMALEREVRHILNML
jgi:hypothetical protein